MKTKSNPSTRLRARKKAGKILAAKKIFKPIKKAKKILVLKGKKNIKKPQKKKIVRPKIIVRKITKKPAVHRTKHKAEEKDGDKFAAESLFKAKIKVVGVGGGGGSIVSEVSRTLQKATFVVADTDVRALKKKTGIK